MKQKPYYVLLTGGKNNAGDFLIKYRAIQLFKINRPDRDIVDIDAWKDRDDEILETFNNSQAVILTGGPALRPNMYPEIYKVLGNIDDIKAPILTMAIGWRVSPGLWSQTHSYTFSNESLKLLHRINSSGYKSSVRDYHSLNVLLHKGFNSFIMTGCAALYDADFIGKEYNNKVQIDRVAVSLGVSFVNDKGQERNFKNLVLGLQEKYGNSKINVAFHHSLDATNFNNVYAIDPTFLDKHQKFADWLSSEDIEYTDISGSAENLIDYYNQADFHIGYRVHAHIYMSSVNKLSLLIAEDGRGKALKDVINGLVIQNDFISENSFKNTLFLKGLVKMGWIEKADHTNYFLTSDIINNLSNEEMFGFNRIKKSRILIDALHKVMKKFIRQLP